MGNTPFMSPCVFGITLCMLHLFSSANFFFKINFYKKKKIIETIRVHTRLSLLHDARSTLYQKALECFTVNIYDSEFVISDKVHVLHERTQKILSEGVQINLTTFFFFFDEGRDDPNTIIPL